MLRLNIKDRRPNYRLSQYFAISEKTPVILPILILPLRISKPST